MFKDAHRRRFDLLVFWSLDRFSREGLQNVTGYLKRLKSNGVGYHSYTEELISSEADDLTSEIVLAVMACIANYESKRTSQRVRARLAQLQEDGKRLGRPSKVDKALPVYRELANQLELSGRTPTRAELARKVGVELGIEVSVSTIDRCRRRIEAEKGRENG